MQIYMNLLPFLRREKKYDNVMISDELKDSLQSFPNITVN